MNLKELFTEDRGVSPVIGVILMVAITVILAAVIGAFVLGLGDQASSSAPQAQFSFSYDSGDEDSTVTIGHSGGQNVDTTELSVRVAGETIYDRGNLVAGDAEINVGDSTFNVDQGPSSTWDEIASTGDRQEIQLDEDDPDSDDIDDLNNEEVQIIWTSSDGGSSNVIATSRWSV